MNPVEIIAHKRDGKAHSQEQIEYFIGGLGTDVIELHQASAWLMATRLRGMTDQETIWLTKAMLESGDTVDLSSLKGVPVDKHSTGGVGDTTTLILAPLVAAAGGTVAKMSGRGLGHTGGTLDKMEAAGLNVDLSSERFMAQVRDIGVAVISQTSSLVPADGMMYSLRDVTATIDSIPLIASSVMSKKLACGAQAILLDVKYGEGAFMATLESARELAQLMVKIGNGLGRRVKAALSTMDQPLGNSIGNALEFKEAIEVLTGQSHDTSLARVSQELASELLVLSGVSANSTEARKLVSETLSSGKAAEKLKQLIKFQDGDPRIVDDTSLLPQAPIQHQVKAIESGYISALAAKELGMAGLKLGAGRLRKSDKIDPAVGIVLEKRVGDAISRGDTIATIHAASQQAALDAQAELLQAVNTSKERPHLNPEIAEWVS